MEGSLILADQILGLIKQAGVTKTEASAALSVALTVLPAIDGIPLISQDEREAMAL